MVNIAKGTFKYALLFASFLAVFTIASAYQSASDLNYNIDFLYNDTITDTGTGSGFDVNFTFLDSPTGNYTGAGYDVNVCAICHLEPTIPKLAQSFRLDQDFTVGSVDLRLKKTGNPNWVNISVQSNLNGVPSGQKLIERNFEPSSISTAYSFGTYDFNSSVTLAGNTTYWIVANVDEGTFDANASHYNLDGNGGYSNGKAMFLNTYDWNNDRDLDYAFKIGNFQATVITTKIIPIIDVSKLVLVSLQPPDSNITYAVSRNAGADWQTIPMTHIGNNRTGIDSYYGKISVGAWTIPDGNAFVARALIDANSQLHALGAKWRWTG